MAKRVVWKDGDLVSLKLRDGLYTIGQMLTSPAMRFYDVRSEDGRWTNLDLNKARALFRVLVGNIVLQQLVEEKIKDKSVIPSSAPYERLWIKPYLNYEGPYSFKGGRLIDLGPHGNISTTDAPALKENLSLERDGKIISETELTNMWGAEDLGDRLRFCFDSGKDKNPLKEQVFPGWRNPE